MQSLLFCHGSYGFKHLLYCTYGVKFVLSKATPSLLPFKVAISKCLETLHTR